MDLTEALSFFTNIFYQHNIPYTTVGGFAIGVLGRARATSDLDFLIDIPPSKVSSLLTAIEDSGLKISRKDSVERKLITGLPAKIILDAKLSVDLRLAQFRIDADAIANAVPYFVHNIEFLVTPAEELIVYKLARFRGLDREDIRGILRKQQNHLDWNAVISLANTLSVEADNPKIIENLNTVLGWRRPPKRT